MIVSVIMAGGVGTRLWPLSCKCCPKPFNNLFGELTLFQYTVIRATKLSSKLIIVCNEAHRLIVEEQLKAISTEPDFVILEPGGRNTAPAMALAAFQALSFCKDSTLLLFPADHWIEEEHKLFQAISSAKKVAENGALVTLGCLPLSAETGYGYIKKGGRLVPERSAYNIDKFVEKPKRALAEQYIQQGDYYWNMGIFMMQTIQYLEALKEHALDIYTVCHHAMMHIKQEGYFIYPDQQIFLSCRSDSIDYAVMEKTNKSAVVITDMKWSDMGSWEALHKVGEKDHKNNSIVGDVFLDGVENSYIHSTNRLIVASGVKDCIIVETPDALLVADRDSGQCMKELVRELDKSYANGNSFHSHWGTSQLLRKDNAFEIKKISIKPGRRTSFEAHPKFSTHLTVIEGKAKINKKDQLSILEQGGSTIIPKNISYFINNIGESWLKIIQLHTHNC